MDHQKDCFKKIQNNPFSFAFYWRLKNFFYCLTLESLCSHDVLMWVFIKGTGIRQWRILKAIFHYIAQLYSHFYISEIMWATVTSGEFQKNSGILILYSCFNWFSPGPCLLFLRKYINTHFYWTSMYSFTCSFTFSFCFLKWFTVSCTQEWDLQLNW